MVDPNRDARIAEYARRIESGLSLFGDGDGPDASGRLRSVRCYVCGEVTGTKYARRDNWRFRKCDVGRDAICGECYETWGWDGQLEKPRW